MPIMTTARDRPPEEAAEDTSFARGLRVLLTIADRGEIRADELSVAARHARSRRSIATSARSASSGSSSEAVPGTASDRGW